MGGATDTAVDSFGPDKKLLNRRRRILELVVSEPGKWNRSRLTDELEVDFRDIEDAVIRLRRDDMIIERTGRLTATKDGEIMVRHALKRMTPPKPTKPADPPRAARTPEQCEAIVASELAAKGELTAGDLWKRTTLDVSEVKRALDAMEQRGEVERRPGSRFILARPRVHIDKIEAEQIDQDLAPEEDARPETAELKDDLPPPAPSRVHGNSHSTPRQDQVVAVIERHPDGIAPAAITAELGTTKGQTTSALRGALAAGRVRATGQRAARRYFPLSGSTRGMSDRGLSRDEAMEARSKPIVPKGGGDQNVRVKCARCTEWMRYGQPSKATPRTRSKPKPDLCTQCAARVAPTTDPIEGRGHDLKHAAYRVSRGTNVGEDRPEGGFRLCDGARVPTVMHRGEEVLTGATAPDDEVDCPDCAAKIAEIGRLVEQRRRRVLVPLLATVAELAREELEDAEADLARMELEVELQRAKVAALRKLAGG